MRTVTIDIASKTSKIEIESEVNTGKKVERTSALNETLAHCISNYIKSGDKVRMATAKRTDIAADYFFSILRSIETEFFTSLSPIRVDGYYEFDIL